MWLWITLTGILLAQTQAQFPTECLQKFDASFRKCFKDNGNFALETIFSLVTNGTSGPLPAGANKEQLAKTACGKRQILTQCATPLPGTITVTCNDQERNMMESTIQSMTRAIGVMCGAEPGPPQCLQAFDTNFRQCLASNQIMPDNFFMLLSNQSLPMGVTRESVKASACGPKLQTITQCTTGFMSNLQTKCNQQEQMMVGQTLQNMMMAYQQTCLGGQPGGGPATPPCLQTFESRMDQCAMTTIHEPMSKVLMLLSNQSIPDAAALKTKLCANWRNVENCGKNVVANAGCDANSLLMVEGAFSNMMISIASYCGDKSVPGACILTLQNEFGRCYGEVGLDEAQYFSNSSQERGAIIGNSREAALEYCSKTTPLYACMTKIMKGCQGAEQTLALTGFDIAAMERAIGTLCNDIPEYLDGLSCFQDATDIAKGCMDEMAKGITTLSAKQVLQSMNMDGFFVDFCNLRVKHVACDSAAWPSCKKGSVELKTKFECLLLPNKCHDINEAAITKVCHYSTIPHTDDTAPAGPVADQCTKSVQTRLTQCMQGYDLDASLFVVNVTHDRGLILGNKAEAERFCDNHAEVYSCMRKTLRQCPGSVGMLKYWGHQQDALEKAVDILCKDVKVYETGISCMKNPNAQVRKCVQDTQSSMLQLSSKQETQRLSPAAYFREFCPIRVNHLQCDLKAWSQCDKAVVGLKTEFECTLLQDECKGATSVSSVCSSSNFAIPEREKLTGTRRRTTSGSIIDADNSAITASLPSYVSMITVFLTTLSLL